MYGIDEDLAAGYDPQKVAAGIRVPKFPHVEAQLGGLLKRVIKDKSKNYGIFYEFRFVASSPTSVKSCRYVKDDDGEAKLLVEPAEGLVADGTLYSLRFFPGVSEISRDMFWRNITAPLMAVNGETTAESFNAMQALGKLLSICKDDEKVHLDLPFKMSSRFEQARPNKMTGEVKVDKEGNPRVYRQDEFSPAG